MRRAIAVARKGQPQMVHPNPRVGAVIVHKGKIVSEGGHERFGGPHAEVVAIKRLSKIPAGAVLYVTLEPCAHFGKTPPCTDLIIQSGIRRVVIGNRDPHPCVNGRGIGQLRTAGIKVTSGVLDKEVLELNRDFYHWVRTGRPYVVIKIAESLDGKSATPSGQSKWITQTKARRMGRQLRAECDAVLVGSGTVLKDDPGLNAGRRGSASPIKIVLDSRLRTPLRARLFGTRRRPSKVILAISDHASRSAKAKAARKAALLTIRRTGEGRLDWKELLPALGKLGIVRLLVEGGSETIASLLKEKLAQEICFFIAPTIIGGRNSIGAVGGEGPADLRHAVKLKHMRVSMAGRDLMIKGVL